MGADCRAAVRPREGSEDLASWSARAGALLVDVAVVAAIALALLLMVRVAGLDRSFGTALVYAISLLYAPLLMMRPGEHNGQTLGKQAASIRVVRESPLQPDLPAAAGERSR